MKIAIHKSSWGFSQDWIAYCERENIPYKIINCYDSDIINQIADCDVLMWHHHHTIAKDALFAKQLLFAVQQSGKIVFPDFNSGWHFDDKIGQKYLLESVQAPYASTYVFIDKKEALTWAQKTTYPKVFKLRIGAGSSNVKLIKNKTDTEKAINKSFGKGFTSYDKMSDLHENIRRFNWNKQSVIDLLKSVRRIFVSTQFAKTVGMQKGYILFQDFIPDNKYDIRVVVIGERAFAIKRLVRNNDFRASGSGFILYDKSDIDDNCVRVAFETTEKINAQCIAYDFVFDSYNNPLIVEINYGYDHKAYFSCPGYWDRQLKWHEGKFNSAEWMVEELIKSIND